MYLAILHYKVPRKEIELYLTAHKAFLREGYDNNDFIVSGPQFNRKGGVIISTLTRALFQKVKISMIL